MNHTGFRDSRLNKDKDVLITQILVFPSVWNPGCITSSFLIRMCGIQDVAQFLVFFLLVTTINITVILLEKNQIKTTYPKFLLKQREDYC